MFKLEIEHQVLLHLSLLPFRAADVISQFKLKMHSVAENFEKKIKTNFFFFIFVDEIDFFSFWWKTKFFLQRNYLYENGLVCHKIYIRERGACMERVHIMSTIDLDTIIDHLLSAGAAAACDALHIYNHAICLLYRYYDTCYYDIRRSRYVRSMCASV